MGCGLSVARPRHRSVPPSSPPPPSDDGPRWYMHTLPRETIPQFPVLNGGLYEDGDEGGDDIVYEGDDWRLYYEPRADRPMGGYSVRGFGGVDRVIDIGKGKGKGKEKKGEVDIGEEKVKVKVKEKKKKKREGKGRGVLEAIEEEEE